MLPCFKPEVTYDLDQEAQNSCNLLGFTHEDIVKIKVRFDDIDIELYQQPSPESRITVGAIARHHGETKQTRIEAVKTSAAISANQTTHNSGYANSHAVSTLLCENGEIGQLGRRLRKGIIGRNLGG